MFRTLQSIQFRGSRIEGYHCKVGHSTVIEGILLIYSSIPEEVGRGYDDIQMSHDKYRLRDDIILHSAHDKILNIFDIHVLVRVT